MAKKINTALYKSTGGGFDMSKLPTANILKEIEVAAKKPVQKQGASKPQIISNPPQSKDTLFVDNANDPRLKAYTDSLNLYKGYEFQKKELGKYGTQEYYGNINLKKDSYKPVKMSKEEIIEFNRLSNDSYKNKASRQALEAFAKKHNTKTYAAGIATSNNINDNVLTKKSPSNVIKSSKKVIDYYRSLGIPNSNINHYPSPDLYHPKIKPIAEYFDGYAHSPVYQRPVRPVVVRDQTSLINLPQMDEFEVVANRINKPQAGIEKPESNALHNDYRYGPEAVGISNRKIIEAFKPEYDAELQMTNDSTAAFNNMLENRKINAPRASTKTDKNLYSPEYVRRAIIMRSHNYRPL